ncbi:hypothetical protein LS68_003320 [Helicobacter sp. MIT 05-5293]|uniref:DUF5675 family protein n=1 Tax=Helicobacter sp. MIT 05-5293 TaxID=1548149 RepID=UPI00051D0BD2|nr:DUF5675 family protein [Helicobacter sp. MIT 05-5293]TLD82045.1 hypothetical protein LS68_003320 [Helicobacter sp. MIT 05-5293]
MNEIYGVEIGNNGNIIGEKTKQYEYYNPNNLPTNNPYAYILERNGHDSIGGEIKLRIPEGRYNTTWHRGNIFTNVLKLHNGFIGKGREILIHNGKSPKHSAGCLLIGDKIALNIINGETMREILANLLKNNTINNDEQDIKEFIARDVEVRIINKFKEESKKIEQKNERLYTLDDAKEALKIIYHKYGEEMARIIEKMYRSETAHFDSGQYKHTGTGGMEAFGNAPYYGWDSKFFDQNPNYKPIGIWSAYEGKGIK